MSYKINFKKELTDEFDHAIDRVTKALKASGFGIMSRIDMHSKIEEKLGKKIPKVTILGACNPSMAYDAYTTNSDVASLLPCNAVVRDIGNGRVSIEMIRPSAMMEILRDKKLEELSFKADTMLEEALRII